MPLPQLFVKYCAPGAFNRINMVGSDREFTKLINKIITHESPISDGSGSITPTIQF